MMKRAVIFGNDHTNSVGIIQSLGIAGYSCTALLFGKKTGLVKSSKFTERVITGKNPQDCINKLLTIKFENTERLPIVAGSDTCALFLEKNKEKLKKNFVFEHTTSKFSIADILEKNTQVRFAKEVGFDVPESIEFIDVNSINIEQIHFKPPYIFKPLVSLEGSKADITICKSIGELEVKLKTILPYTRVIVQQYIERDYEISILGCALSHGDTIIPAIEHKLTLYPKFVGLECLANIQPLNNDEIKNCIERLIKKIGYVGLFSVEMMHSKTDNKYYFTEINPRNDGAQSFITKYGANLPLNHIEDLLEKPLTPINNINPGYYIWDFHQFMSLIHRDISIVQFLKEFRMSNGMLMYTRGDTKPFFKQYKNWFLEKLKIRKHSCY